MNGIGREQHLPYLAHRIPGCVADAINVFRTAKFSEQIGDVAGNFGVAQTKA